MFHLYRIIITLPNKPGSAHPMHSKANLLMPDCGKESTAFIARHQTRITAANAQKTQNSSMAFGEGVLKPRRGTGSQGA